MDTKKINNLNFKANIKLTPFTKQFVSNMSAPHITRFMEAQKKLNQLPISDELMISRKKLKDGRIVPVITNLANGAMLLPMVNGAHKLSSSLVKMVEDIAEQKGRYSRKIFSKNINVINNSINEVLEHTDELSIHPIAAQNLNHLDLNEEQQLLMMKFEKSYPDKELIFQLSEDKKLFIKSYDEGYIYYIGNAQKIPTGEFFTVTYSKDGFIINYNESTFAQDKILKYFNRYTHKGLERLNKA